MKKENELLQNQLIVVSKEKEFYLLLSKRLKKILMHIKFHIKLNFLALIKCVFFDEKQDKYFEQCFKEM